jgi:aspartyl-tRNA(Asn)/glutamyl-tRNA(Gln) amidotransferase subunit A
MKKKTSASSEDLWKITLAEASARIQAARLSPVELLEAYLDRIAEVDNKIHSYICVAAEPARQAARRAESELRNGIWKGPLHGIPFAVKDNYDVAGLPATAGSRLRLGYTPEVDAPLVADLKAAGAVLIGKLATWEFGTGNGGEYFDLPFPPARNPWDVERFTGGSSTGAGAAVAAGTTLFALGSDTTGSVRLPAAACGAVGMITTPGRLSTQGILPNCWSLDTPGPFAWTVQDCAMILDTLLGPPAANALPQRALSRSVGMPISGLRIAVVDDPGPGFPQADRPLQNGLHKGLEVLEKLGARLTYVKLPIPAAECFAASRMIGPAESAAIHEDELKHHADQMGFALRDKLLAGSLVRAVDYLAAQRLRRAIATSLDTLLRGYDALVTFGTLHLPPKLGVEPEMTAFTVETMLTPFNLSGHPALVQCNGFAKGLPLNWQIIGNRGDEATILQIAGAYEAATPWRNRRPTL